MLISFVSCKFLGEFKHFFVDLFIGNMGTAGSVIPKAKKFRNGNFGNIVGYANCHGKGRTSGLET